MKRTLRMTTWKLFVFLMLPFLLLPFVPVNALLMLLFVCFVWYYVILSWFYQLGSRLHPMQPDGAKLSLPRFLLALMFQAMYGLAFTVFVTDPTADKLVYMIPVQIVSAVAYGAITRFVAKALVSAEAGKPVSLAGYMGEWIQFWFFPIGVWRLQPRIREVFKDEFL